MFFTGFTDTIREKNIFLSISGKFPSSEKEISQANISLFKGIFQGFFLGKKILLPNAKKEWETKNTTDTRAS